MRFRPLISVAVLLACGGALADGKPASYSDAHAIFARNCLACHDAKEAEGGLVLETRETILAGGDSGAAVVRGGAVEIRSARTQGVIRTLPGHRGNVNDVKFSGDGKVLAAGGGQAGEDGEVRIWNVADAMLIHTFEGHADAIHSLAISP